MPTSGNFERPDPDALLARVQDDTARAQRGRLKIFFGATAGVGKSYAMLEVARRQQADGVDVVVGYVELHGRPETEALLDGLEVLPPMRLDHRGLALTEFDLDAALARRPQLLLVDELAHSNHPGARHPKRWQDVQELLEAGIDVYTTVNVQHLESLNDVVAQITGVQVRETVPDKVFAEADDVELVDLPPDELLERLREGKVYLPDKARQAADGFFRKGNLIALRQLALRATADRVDAALREYRDRHAISATWAATDRILVCVGPDPLSARLVRSARRMATASHAPWLAVYVETPALTHLPQSARDRILATLKLAEQLGAETANLSGESVPATLLAFARQRNVSRIVVGKPARGGWLARFRPSLVDELIRRSGAIDVYVINGEIGDEGPATPRIPMRSSRWPAYAKALAVIAMATLIGSQMVGRFESTNVVMVYLLGTVLVAARFGRGPSVLASVLSVALFDFLFVPPQFSFAVSDTQYLITFGVMLTTALVVSHLTALGKRQASVARQRERRSAELYALSRELARRRNLEDLSKYLVRHVLASVDGEAAVLLPDADGKIQDPTHFCDRGAERAPAQRTHYPVPGNDLGIAQWAYDHRRKAGLNTDTLASAGAIYLPLLSLKSAGKATAPAAAESRDTRCIGVLGLRPVDPRQLSIPEQMHLVEALVNQTAVAMERVQLADAAQRAGVQVESERLRNTLLAAISHDFRTPLATIIGAASTLQGSALDAPQRQALLDGVLHEAQRMNRLIGNLLDLTRLSEEPIPLRRDWIAVDELVGAVLARLRELLATHPVTLRIEDDLPLVSGDEVMLEQLLSNLLENAARHTPPGTAVEIAARTEGADLALNVRDHGGGFRDGEEARVFDKFHQGARERAQSGFGLGLAICKAIVDAHGGTIDARNADGGGAEFRVRLPLRPREVGA
ncbi:sensor histidine kinase KdpD [Dokdonella sp.]|uniref:sensor histidine kinase n=1 Tax=Dokdonella sp. TaxID=2291710 RepID=UPI001B185D24|nr:sensor histidine kinase KdpD [Dokdonella sp.]MBO9664143.1 sensor histidine kinase KdpD [Dokdonella sp.]